MQLSVPELASDHNVEFVGFRQGPFEGIASEGHFCLAKVIDVSGDLGDKSGDEQLGEIQVHDAALETNQYNPQQFLDVLLEDDLGGDGAHPADDIVAHDEFNDLVHGLGELGHGVSDRCPVFGSLFLTTLLFDFGPGERAGEPGWAEIVEHVSRGLARHVPAVVFLGLLLLQPWRCCVGGGGGGVDALTAGIEYGECDVREGEGEQ